MFDEVKKARFLDYVLIGYARNDMFLFVFPTGTNPHLVIPTEQSERTNLIN